MHHSPLRLLDALDSLPETLNEIYTRILDGIPKEQRDDAVRLLQFLVYAVEPLTVDAVIDLLATTPEGNPKFDPRNRAPDPMALLEECCSLVMVGEPDWREGRGEVRLAHYSVKEYLTSGEPKGYLSVYFQETEAQASLTKVCLAYLSYLDNYELSFWHYSSQYWMVHARAAETLDSIQDLILEFLSQSQAVESSFPALLVLPLWNASLPWAPEPLPQQHFRPSALYIATRFQLLHTINNLIVRGADVDVGGFGFESPLRAACLQGDYQIARCLLWHGANLDLEGGPDPQTNTNLMISLSRRDESLVALLLEHGANPNLECRFPAHYANLPSLNFSMPLHLAADLQSEKLAQLLLEKGADVNARGQQARVSVIFLASERDHLGLIKLLLERGASLDAYTKECSLFYRSCRELFLEHGPEIETGGFLFSCPLHAASAIGHSAMVEALLDEGKDVHAADEHGWTALSFAMYCGHQVVCKKLRSHISKHSCHNHPTGPLRPAFQKWFGDPTSIQTSQGMVEFGKFIPKRAIQEY